MAEGACVFSALHCHPDLIAHWVPHECFPEHSTWCVQNWSSASTSLSPQPLLLSVSSSQCKGIFILLVGLVRNLGFILDSFFFFPFLMHIQEQSINMTLQNSAKSESVFTQTVATLEPGSSFRPAVLSHRPPSFLSVHSCAHPHLQHNQEEELL